MPSKCRVDPAPHFRRVPAADLDSGCSTNRSSPCDSLLRLLSSRCGRGARTSTQPFARIRSALECLRSKSSSTDVKQDELKEVSWAGSRAMEQRNAEELEALIRDNGGKPSSQVGPFAGKVAALGTIRDRLKSSLTRPGMGRAQNRSRARASPEQGPIHDYLTRCANRHRAEVRMGSAPK